MLNNKGFDLWADHCLVQKIPSCRPDGHNKYSMEQGILEGRIRYKYRQFGLTTTFVTVPVHDMAFVPGFSTGKSPLM